MKSKKNAIIFFGAPGSGKGIQGNILSEKTGFKKYVISSIIKKSLNKKPNKQDLEKLKIGKLLDDIKIFEILKENFKNYKNIILDGIPRNKTQAIWLKNFLEKKNYNFKLIYLEVNEKNLELRINSRRYCPKCNKQYNLLVLKPKIKEICDIDKTKLIQRVDDKLEIFKKRMEKFDKVKDDILTIFKGKVLKINGDRKINIISEDIISNKELN